MDRILRDDEVMQSGDIYRRNGKKVFVIKGWWIGKKVNELDGYSEGGITVTRPGGKAMAKFRMGDRVRALASDSSHKKGDLGTIDSWEDDDCPVVLWDNGNLYPEFLYYLKPIKGGKPMKSKKEYKKGKTIYLQFNCPTNDDDPTLKGSPNKDDMNPDYPFTQVKLTGDVYEMKQTWKTVKVK